jgi:hypothetical protein
VAVGTIGIVRPADVSIDDIDMYYNYTPNRQTSNTVMLPLVATEILSYAYLPDADPLRQPVTNQSLLENSNILEGIYNLRLPASIFNQLGIYTIYIKPKTYKLQITDCSVLSSLPSVNGITINVNDLPTTLQANNALQGFKVEYLNADGTKLRNVVRYVVTSNKVVPVNENIGNTTQKATRYRFDDTGSLIFLQLTPSSSSDVKPNVLPFIGNPTGIILLSNTFFSPLAVEVEMVDTTLETLADIVAGEQMKDVQNGILTYYDKNRNIIKQFNLFEAKDQVTNVPVYELKELRDTIDTTQDITTVLGEIPQ